MSCTLARSVHVHLVETIAADDVRRAPSRQKTMMLLFSPLPAAAIRQVDKHCGGGGGGGGGGGDKHPPTAG